MPDWLLGAALNPFKYREEEGGAQYLKAQKKLLAGADFLTLQLGFDDAKHIEAQTWMRAQPRVKPMLACVMELTDRRAAVLQGVPGIVITESMRELLGREQEVSKAYASARSLERLALQIVGLQLMGYAGVHVSGLHTLAELLSLEQAITEQRDSTSSMPDWLERWQASWQMPGASQVGFVSEIDAWKMGQSEVTAFAASACDTRCSLRCMASFSVVRDGSAKHLAVPVTRPIWKTGAAANALHTVERAIKRPLVGCIPQHLPPAGHSLYLPRNMPQRLANGPCGGTQLNRCEFGDRECVHSVKYRVAKSAHQLPRLAQTLIPAIDADNRHRSSWPQWFEAHDSTPAQGKPRIN